MKTFQVTSGNHYIEIKADSFASNGETGLILYAGEGKELKIVAMFSSYNYILEKSEKNEGR